jgi:hypothetical protein
MNLLLTLIVLAAIGVFLISISEKWETGKIVGIILLVPLGLWLLYYTLKTITIARKVLGLVW